MSVVEKDILSEDSLSDISGDEFVGGEPDVTEDGVQSEEGKPWDKL